MPLHKGIWKQPEEGGLYLTEEECLYDIISAYRSILPQMKQLSEINPVSLVAENQSNGSV